MKKYIIPALLLATPVEAQSNCAPRETIVMRMQTMFSESQVWLGIRDQNSTFELWMSPETGRWTILMSRPDGISCVMTAGEVSSLGAEAAPEPSGLPF